MESTYFTCAVVTWTRCWDL